LKQRVFNGRFPSLRTVKLRRAARQGAFEAAQEVPREVQPEFAPEVPPEVPLEMPTPAKTIHQVPRELTQQQGTVEESFRNNRNEDVGGHLLAGLLVEREYSEANIQGAMVRPFSSTMGTVPKLMVPAGAASLWLRCHRKATSTPPVKLLGNFIGVRGTKHRQPSPGEHAKPCMMEKVVPKAKLVPHPPAVPLACTQARHTFNRFRHIKHVRNVSHAANGNTLATISC